VTIAATCLSYPYCLLFFEKYNPEIYIFLGRILLANYCNAYSENCLSRSRVGMFFSTVKCNTAWKPLRQFHTKKQYGPVREFYYTMSNINITTTTTTTTTTTMMMIVMMLDQYVFYTGYFIFLVAFSIELHIGLPRISSPGCATIQRPAAPATNAGCALKQQRSAVS